MSDSTASPRTRFRCAQARCSSEGYIRVDGEVIATGWDDLTDGALAVPISITELNQADADNPSDIWTHTNPDGSAVASANHCQDWTSSSPDDDGHDGDSSLSDTRWTNEGPIGCNVPRRLYCFQQT